MKQSWEMETSIENTEPVQPLINRLKETSKEENDSDDWLLPVK
jgi:hypothetical protein